MQNNIKKQLLKRARFGSFLLSFVPFIKMIAVSGSLAEGSVNKNSDIDFFIITEKNHLWTVRFLSILILDLFCLRAKGSKHRGKICLNHFLSSSTYLLTPKTKYNAHQYSNLKILYELDDAYKQFILKNNWMKNYCQAHKYRPRENKPNIIKLILEHILRGLAGGKLEHKLYHFQVKRIRLNSFFHLKGSLLKISSDEFYYYTNPH